MILIKDINFKEKLDLLSLNYYGGKIVDPSEHMFQKFYNNTKGNVFYPFFMRYPITEHDFCEAVDPAYLLQLKEKKIKPLIIMVTECWELFLQNRRTKLSPYQIIVNKFLEYGIIENEIYWIVNNINIEQEINELKKKGTSIRANFYHFNYFLQYQQTSKIFKETQNIQYHFASLSQGSLRHHRYGITYGLHQYDLIKKGKISCPAFKNFKYNFVSDSLLINLDTKEYLKKFNFYKNNLEEFEKILPLILDNKTNQYHNYDYENNLIKDVFINIVNETHHPNNTFFVTEKTFRSIAHGKPFLINGDPGTLKYLKSIGFKTFDQWWDESYDEIKNEWERIESLLKIVKNICSQSTEKCMRIYQEMLPTLKHNWSLLNNINEYKNFENL
jgi:hypothetical protein|tara:strand:+ start:70 stop:1230 length:1161 start_codon:yes stop_codon:yes gene_type:complete